MTQETWNTLDVKEQLSNIHGEVVRGIRARNNYKAGRAKEDTTAGYISKIHNLIEMTCEDPKNVRRKQELIDEENEIKLWYEGGVSDAYLIRYWEQYTNAIS